MTGLRPLPSPRAVEDRIRVVLTAAGFHGFGVTRGVVGAGYARAQVCVRRGDNPAAYVAALEADNIWRARYEVRQAVAFDYVAVLSSEDG